jgi:hypothetical protein
VFLERVMRYLNNALATAEGQELRKQLEAEPAKRDIFVRVCLVDTLARERLAIQNSDFIHLDDDEVVAGPVAAQTGSLHDAIAFPAIHLDPEPEEPTVHLPPPEGPEPRPTTGPGRLRRWGTAAAILVALGAAFAIVRRLAAPPAATIEALSDAQWEGDEATALLSAHAPVPSGRSLSLARGCASLRFAGGTEVIVEAPARFTIDSAEAISLAGGKLAVKLAPGSSGFTVKTPTGVVTDLGTEFGVACDAVTGNTEVDVFKGSVRVQPSDAKSAPAQDVHAGDAARVAPGIVTLAPNQSEPQRFVRSLDASATSLDLADLLSGGDGTTRLRTGLLDAATGNTRAVTPAGEVKGDGNYRRVTSIPVVDGCLIPDGTTGPSIVDSARHTFLFPPTDHTTYSRICAGGVMPVPKTAIPIGTIINGVNYHDPGHGFIFAHSNSAVTFDLAAVRRLHPKLMLTRFRCVVGSSFDLVHNLDRNKAMEARDDAYLLVDGHLRFERRGFRIRDGGMNVDIPLADADRFLTLASTDGGDSHAYDDTLFGDPVFDVTAK